MCQRSIRTRREVLYFCSPWLWINGAAGGPLALNIEVLENGGPETRLAAPSTLTKAVHENVGKSQRGLLPVGGVVDVVDHAQKCAQKILGRDVGADVAGLNCAVEQRADGFP